MAKTLITLEIEYALYKHYYLDRSQRPFLEVKIPRKGRCDLVVANKEMTDYTAIEIKVSKADFKSKHGHNLNWAHKNYYATTSELVDYVISQVPSYIGVIEVKTNQVSYDSNQTTYEVRIVKPAKRLKQKHTPYFNTALKNNLVTANCSNTRRFLEQVINYSKKEQLNE